MPVSPRRKYCSFLLLFIAFYFLSSCETNRKQATKDEVPHPYPFELTVVVPHFKEPHINIQDVGAQQEEGFDNSVIINEAISKLSQQGGGKVIIPKGTWFSSSIKMQSNVNLHLEEEATLSFSDKKDDYLPPVFTRWQGIECMNYSALIYAKGCENIAITGKGTLQGNGQKWWKEADIGKKVSFALLSDMVIKGVPAEKRIMVATDSLSHLRPSFVQFIDCKNVLLEDYTILDGPMWTNHLIYCKNVIAKNLSVITNGANNDGLVLDSSEDILIEGCYFSTGDDCVVIKSGINEDGWIVNKPTRNVVIRDCFTKHGHGGVVIGSEMSGGIENIVAHNCTFNNTERGLRIKSKRGRGGYVKNIYFYDIKMNNIRSEAIMVNMRYTSSAFQPIGDKLPTFSNINIHDITSKNSSFAIKMQGLADNPIEGIRMENIFCDSSKYGIGLDNCRNIQMQSVNINSTKEGIFKFDNNENIVLENVIINQELVSGI